MQLAVLAIDGVFDTGLAVTLDAFSTASSLSATLFGGTPRFDVTTVGVRRLVRTSQGLTVPVQPIKPSSKPDWVIVPAVLAGTPEELFAKLERADVRDARSQLLKWSAKGALIGAACMGTFILAATGLLNQQESTTTWSLAPFFRQRFPEIHLDESRMVVPCDIGVTAGSAMGHLDLALWVIRQASPELAGTVSHYMTADLRSSQAPFIIPNHLAQADPMILRFERWARLNLKDGFSLQAASKALATSARTLQRRCQIYWANPLSPTFRTCAWSTPSLFSIATVTISRQSRQRLATRMAPPCVPSCTTGSDVASERSALVSSKSMRRVSGNGRSRRLEYTYRQRCGISTGDNRPMRSSSQYDGSCLWHVAE